MVLALLDGEVLVKRVAPGSSVKVSPAKPAPAKPAPAEQTSRKRASKKSAPTKVSSASRPSDRLPTAGEFESLARDLVTNAMSASFHDDPVIGAELSRPFSIASSAICRHGLAIQSVISDTLAAQDRFEVLRNQPLPITRTASELASSRTSASNLRKVMLRADASVERIVNIDLVVIDEAAGWIGAFDCKRGAGPTATAKRRALERDLIALRLSLPSWARQLGYVTIEDATSGIIDYYGKAGFRSELTISRGELDEMFGVAISPRVDQMTVAVRAALHSGLPALFGKSRPPGEPKPSITRAVSSDCSIITLFDERGRLQVKKPFGPRKSPKGTP